MDGRAADDQRPLKQMRMMRAPAPIIKTTDTAYWRSAALKDPEAIAKALDAAESAESTKCKDFSVHKHSSTIVLDGVFNEKLLRSARNELLNMTFAEHRTDLSLFTKTDNLSNVDQNTAVGKLRDALYSKDFLDFLQNAAGTEFTGAVDLAGYIYRSGDHAACHSDFVPAEHKGEDGRREAFTIFLNSGEWPKKFGGQLAVFCLDTQGQPFWQDKVIESVGNRMVLFGVAPNVFHETRGVSVPTERENDMFHLSIRGYFHASNKTRESIGGFSNIWDHCEEVQLLERFVDPKCRSPLSIVKLNDGFKGDRRKPGRKSIVIHNFLRPEVFQRMCKSLKTSFKDYEDEDNGHELVGPADLRRFVFLPAEDNKETLGKAKYHEDFLLQEMFKSSGFREWLKGVAGMQLSPETTRHRVQRRHFFEGCYSANTEYSQDPPGLDVVLNLGNGTTAVYDRNWGGLLKYTEAPSRPGFPGDSTEYTPVPNSLSIVLRKSDLSKGVSYVNRKVEGGMEGRVDIEAVYSVPRSVLG